MDRCVHLDVSFDLAQTLTNAPGVTQGALTQMRTLGGSVGLAAGVIVFNQQLRGDPQLSKVLTSEQLSTIYKSPLAIEQLPKAEQGLVSKIYAEAFSLEMRTATYIAAVCFLVSLLTWQRNPPFKGPPGGGKPKKATEANEMQQVEEGIHKDEA